MIVSINQPAYLPWLGYFDRIAASDLHVVLDTVQFEKNSFVNRNKIRTAKGWTWLTVPVSTGGQFGNLPINRLRIAADTPWARKHWSTIEQTYGRAPWFAEHRDFFAGVYSREWDRLLDLMNELTGYLLRAFAINVPLVSATTIPTTAAKSDLVLEICRRVGATVYLSGPLGRDYLNTTSFKDAGIEIVYHDYRHPEYPQLHPGFEPFMSAIDLLFMTGAKAGAMLRTGQRVEAS